MLSESRTHLNEAGESYFEHLRFAFLVGTMLVAAGLACVVHSIVPAYCTRTASSMVERLRRLFSDRSQLPAVAEESSGALVFVLLLALAVPVCVAVLFLSARLSLGVPIALLSLGVPLAYLRSNPGLDPVD